MAHLEQKFHRQLSNTRIAGRSHEAKRRVDDVSLREIKIRVVKDVEEFRPKFQFLGLCKWQILDQAKVPGCLPRPVKKAAIGGAQLPNTLGTEQRNIEIGLAG